MSTIRTFTGAAGVCVCACVCAIGCVSGGSAQSMGNDGNFKNYTNLTSCRAIDRVTGPHCACSLAERSGRFEFLAEVSGSHHLRRRMRCKLFVHNLNDMGTVRRRTGHIFCVCIRLPFDRRRALWTADPAPRCLVRNAAAADVAKISHSPKLAAARGSEYSAAPNRPKITIRQPASSALAWKN